MAKKSLSSSSSKVWIFAGLGVAALVVLVIFIIAMSGRRGETNSGQASNSPPPPQQTVAPAAAAAPVNISLPTQVGQTCTNSVGMKLAYIPAGTFLMGSPTNEADRQDNEVQHKVIPTKSFCMGTTPVTQGQWKTVMGNDNNPSFFVEDDLPVETVSCDDAIAFCNALGQKEGKHYRLPTEAEWEYACRAGTMTAYYTGDGDQALDQAGWYNGNSNGKTHPVGQKNPNAWGLYDMHGNVWQWCSDWYGDYPQGDVTDPQGPNQGQDRVLRGGSWFNISLKCRCADRYNYVPVIGHSTFGFRVVLDSE